MAPSTEPNKDKGVGLSMQLAILNNSAQGFYHTGFDAAARAYDNKHTFPIGELVIGAVNLSFACELYLKGILILNNNFKPVHSLVDLFSMMPSNLQIELKARFKSHYEIDIHTIVLERYKIDFAQTEGRPAKTNFTSKNGNFEEFLQLHSKAFVNWRYLFSTDSQSYEIDYRALNCFIKALIEVFDLERRRHGLPDVKIESR